MMMINVKYTFNLSTNNSRPFNIMFTQTFNDTKNTHTLQDTLKCNSVMWTQKQNDKTSYSAGSSSNLCITISNNNDSRYIWRLVYVVFFAQLSNSAYFVIIYNIFEHSVTRNGWTSMMSYSYWSHINNLTGECVR